MIRMLARIKVENFDDFRHGYLLPEHAKMRADGGVINESIQHLHGDPTVVMVIHDFEDLEAAESYMASSVLNKAMHDDGVEGGPSVEYFDVN